MATRDTCCTIVPYFTIHEGKLDAFHKLSEQCVAQTRGEPGCLYYGFSFDGNQAHCREGYVDADAALAHLDNVASLLSQILKIADISRLEVHGPARELDKMRQPMSNLEPQFFVLEYGFRN